MTDETPPDGSESIGELIESWLAEGQDVTWEEIAARLEHHDPWNSTIRSSSSDR